MYVFYWFEIGKTFFEASEAGIFSNITSLTLIRLRFLKVVFSGGEVNLNPFIFQEELIQYQYNFTKLLNKLFKVGWR